MNYVARSFHLRDANLATRLILAAFLVSVGVGYFSALIQLHFQHASPGSLLPTASDAERAYHGRAGISQLERLLLADEGKPFNGSGSMRQTFTTKSAGWKGAINRRAKEKKISLRQAEEELRSERDGERLALLDWVHSGSDRKSFEENNHVLSSQLLNRPITSEFIEKGNDGTYRAKIGSIIENRCARCHGEGKGGSAAQFPLDTFEQIEEYCQVEVAEGGMSLTKLAQTTHVHLLGFSLLYGLTGLIVSLTSYPTWFKALLGPLPLVAQLVDISFWWLARGDPAFARAIIFTGGIVASGLFAQLVLSLFDLFGKYGKIMVVLGLLSLALGGYAAKVKFIDPYLVREGMNALSE